MTQQNANLDTAGIRVGVRFFRIVHLQEWVYPNTEMEKGGIDERNQEKKGGCYGIQTGKEVM